jgi:hypothetical protein
LNIAVPETFDVGVAPAGEESRNVQTLGVVNSSEGVTGTLIDGT